MQVTISNILVKGDQGNVGRTLVYIYSYLNNGQVALDQSFKHSSLLTRNSVSRTLFYM